MTPAMYRYNPLPRCLASSPSTTAHRETPPEHAVVITHEELVFLADPVVEASRRQVLPRVISKHSTVILQLVDEKALHQLVLLRKIRKFGWIVRSSWSTWAHVDAGMGGPQYHRIGQARHLDILPEAYSC